MRILIFANGEASHLEDLAIPQHDLVLCADGGAHLASKLGLTIHGVVGDFDSIDQQLLGQLKQQGVKLHQHPADKDLTDLELCLIEALKHRPSELTLLSALGGRIDHHLTNIFLLAREEYQHISTHIVDRNLRLSYVRGGETALEFGGNSGDLFSLIVLSAQAEGVNISGAKWNLQNAALRFGEARTISNRFKSENVRVSLDSGMLLFVHFTSFVSADL